MTKTNTAETIDTVAGLQPAMDGPSIINDVDTSSVRQMTRQPMPSRAFALPVPTFDKGGRRDNYAADAEAIGRHFIAHGALPSGLTVAAFENPFKYATGPIARPVRDALRLPDTASWLNVLERMEELARHKCPSSQIVQALALPPEDHQGHVIEWRQVLAAAGAKLNDGRATGETLRF